MTEPRTCPAPWCRKPASYGGYCAMHRARLRRRGTLEPVPKINTCAPDVECLGCGKKRSGMGEDWRRGLCVRCYGQVKRNETGEGPGRSSVIEFQPRTDEQRETCLEVLNGRGVVWQEDGGKILWTEEQTA